MIRCCCCFPKCAALSMPTPPSDEELELLGMGCRAIFFRFSHGPRWRSAPQSEEGPFAGGNAAPVVVVGVGAAPSALGPLAGIKGRYWCCWSSSSGGRGAPIP